jgi:vancomycin resistance protein YoaR
MIASQLVAVLTTTSSFHLWAQPMLPQPEVASVPTTISQPSAWPQELTLSSSEKSWTWKQPDLEKLKNSSDAKAGKPSAVTLPVYFAVVAGTKPPAVDSNTLASVNLSIDEANLGQLLLNLAEQIDRPAQNAQLTITAGVATNFIPDRPGQILDLFSARTFIEQALATGQDKIDLAIFEEPAQIQLGDLNNLGIKKLLARGQTDFSGSSASRIQNVRVGTSRYRGLIIKPGEEFSFNQHLGPIDAAHGFLPELVIKPEGTVPEFGGGLCQVSSTAFRAAFYAGLPITQRKNHSYAVRYYEWIADDQPRAPGLDATIYPGAQDLKFINDTPGSILVWTSIEGHRLYFDFYGTGDGREIVVDGPHPYERQASGAVKSTVIRTIIRPDGTATNLAFNSTYVSPNLYPKVFEYPKPENQANSAQSTSTPQLIH